jgi:PAS domain S-box-containing protein
LLKIEKKRFRTLFILAFMTTAIFSFWIAVLLLYTSITKSYEIEFLNKIKANQAELNLLLKERVLLIEQRAMELSWTNAVIVNLMLGVHNQIEESVKKHTPLLAGSFFTVFDIETAQFYPPLPNRLSFLENQIRNGGDGNEISPEVIEKLSHIEIFPFPIKHKGKILGHAVAIYQLSDDATFWARFNKSLKGDIYYATPTHNLSLNPSHHNLKYSFSDVDMENALNGKDFVCFEDYCATKLSNSRNYFFIIPSNEISQKKRQLFFKLGSLGFFLIAISFAVALAVANIFSRPIKNLSQQAYRISKLDSITNLPTDDLFYELGVLCDAFNTVLNKFRSAQKSEEKAKLFLDSIINTVPDPIIVKNDELKIILANDAFCHFVGLERKQIIGKPISDHLNSEEAFCLEKQDQDVLNTGRTNILEQIVTTQHGMRRLINSKKVLFIDPNSGQKLIVGVIRDISEEKALENELWYHKENLTEIVQERTEELIRTNSTLREEIIEKEKAQQAFKETERQLSRAQKMEAIGTLAGGVAHDLNNILAGIITYPDFLLCGMDKENPLRLPIQTIKKSGEKAAAIVQDLLTLARRNLPLFEPINLNHIVNEYFDSPEFSCLKASYPQVAFDFSPQRDLMRILGSPVHLSKAIMNLVTNAAEAISVTGNVLIRTANVYLDARYTAYEQILEGQYVLFSIEDSGCGIKSEDKEKIFEPFFTTKVLGRSGTGLGMAVVWGTVKDHGAYIDLESTIGTGNHS